MSSPLHIELLSPAAEPASGTPLRTLGDARATLGTGNAGPRLSLALPSCSRAETRWIVDKAVRSVAGALATESIHLSLDPAIDDDTGVTLALDLGSRAKGRIEIEARPEIVRGVAKVRPYEDLFKSWVDEDPASRTSLQIAEDVAAFARQSDRVEVEILAEDALAELGLRLLLAVGGGSPSSPARLVLSHYRPKEPSSEPPLMLLGKGITFDTGGINVKPYESFVSMMKNDMAGAALAWSLFRAIVESGSRRETVLVLPTCENAIGPASMRPGAIVESYRGLTVRIDHTDAEGRLVLADGLAYASDRFQPGQIWSFATLTTAALNSYGPFATPVHFADAALEGSLARAAEATGEDLHFFPERVWHLEANRDQEADLRNTARLPGNAQRGAGSRNAAHFLKHFTDRPLCHLDIFGSTWNWSGEAPGAGTGATGAPLRSLLHTLVSP